MEFRIREVREVNELKGVKEKQRMEDAQSSILEPDINFIKNTNLETLIAMNKKKN